MKLGNFCAFSCITVASAISLFSTNAIAEQETGLSMSVSRSLKLVWPWRPEARFKAFSTVTQAAEALWHAQGYGQDIAVLMTNSLGDHPLLVLTDQDGDGRADFYAYYDENRLEITREFGAFFTEPGSKHPYWLVFNGGPSFEMSPSGEMNLFWVNYQFVDRNQDKRFDTYIVNGIDFDADGSGSSADTLWLYDEDFDGKLDRGEHIVNAKAHDLPIVDGVLQTRRLGEDQSDHSFRIGDEIGLFADVIAADIVQALEAGDLE